MENVELHDSYANEVIEFKGEMLAKYENLSLWVDEGGNLYLTELINGKSDVKCFTDRSDFEQYLETILEDSSFEQKEAFEGLMDVLEETGMNFEKYDFLIEAAREIIEKSKQPGGGEMHTSEEQDKQWYNAGNKTKIYKCALCDKKGNTGMIRVLAKSIAEIQQKMDTDCFITEIKLIGLQDFYYKGLLTVDVNDYPKSLKLSEVCSRKANPAQDPENMPF